MEFLRNDFLFFQQIECIEKYSFWVAKLDRALVSVEFELT